MSDAEATGVVSNLQPFSLHDGPGIRTTVFLKGCPLRCAWCHNPETWHPAPVLAFQPRDCTACGACVTVCPNGAQRLSDGQHQLDRQSCTACGACVTACPNRALEVVGERLRADTVLERVLRDEPFFRHSAGGLTLSGGEPTHQLAFSLALLRLAGAAGLHRAVETCAFGEPERILTLLPHTELFLIDWKETDAERHRAYTGVANAGIRANLRVMHDAGARIQLRCPIIPGWNDRPDHFVGIAALARELPRLESVAVMPYHALGTGKAGRFGLPPSPCAGVEAPSEDTVAGWRDALRQLGVPVVA